ncbi:uncharacterized protein JCM6883_004334 [Sporobolomyces salmoneus]|uniref:uncharacterized protein n=1 Tax=Sporobolomyces salmoneus TaxID=183962 RepID=UPI003178A77F
MTTDAEAEAKREKQRKALGAAFLAHQVSELEKSVDHLQFSRDSSRSNNRQRGRTGGGGGGGSGGLRTTTLKIKPIRVVDASTLIHALPVLKKWVREDQYKLVVPLSALATLDILKKAPAPLNDQSRDATRFLETQFNIAKQIQASSSASSTGPEGVNGVDGRIRLRAQNSKEELSWREVEELFKVPEGWKTELPPNLVNDQVDASPKEKEEEEEEEEDELPLPTANDIPRSLRSTLQCVLYFLLQQTQNPPSSSSAKTKLVLFNSHLPIPPPIPSSLLVQQQRTAQSTTSSNGIDYLALSSGDTLSYYLDTFFPSSSSAKGAVSIVTMEEVSEAREWIKKQQAAANARQQQQGGGGNSRTIAGEGVGGRGKQSNGGGRRTGNGQKREGGGAATSTPTAKTLFVP